VERYRGLQPALESLESRRGSSFPTQQVGRSPTRGQSTLL